MSLPLDPSPESESLMQPAPSALEPMPVMPGDVFPAPLVRRFPAWKGWDLLAVLLFTVVCIFVFSLVAIFVARAFPAYRHMSLTDLATDARVVVGAQAAAYPVVLWFIFMLVRTRSHERFGTAIHWNWPGTSAPVFLLMGVVLAWVVDMLARFLPIPKSLPMDNYFHDATGAYMMAIFGITLAPLLEEVFFRGLLYPLLRRAIGLVWAVLLTAVAFAAIHGAQLGYAWAPVLSIFVVGVVFTVVRERRDSVAASFLMHCGYNLTLFTMLWLASDHFRHLEKAVG